MRATLSRIALVSMLGLASCAAAPQPPSLTPIPVEPTLAPSAVPDRFAFVREADGDKVVARIEEIVGASLDAQMRASLLKAIVPGHYFPIWIHDVGSGEWVFVVHSSNGYEMYATKPSDRGFVVVPVEWMQRAVHFVGISAAAERSWDVEMSRRLAANGEASGLALQEHGDAIGIVVSLRRESATNDVVSLLVRNTWRPVLTTPRSGGRGSTIRIWSPT